MRICEAALERGVFAQAIRPPTVPEGTSRLRLAVMASHTKAELRDAARALGRAALQVRLPPRRRRPDRRGAGARATPSAPGRAVRRRGASDPPRRGLQRAVRGVFVTGTDTGVGKTYLAAAMAAGCARRGLRVGVAKPVVTGLDDPGPHDHELLGATTAATFGPAGLAAPGRRAGRRRADAGSAGLGRPRRRRATPTSWSSRASAACWCR